MLVVVPYLSLAVLLDAWWYMTYSDIWDTCLFAGAAEAVVTFIAAIPNESGLEPLHPAGDSPVGEIAAVTA